MKTTAYIGKKGAQTLYYAAKVAKYIRLPLNYFITINFSETDIPALQINDTFLKLKRQLTRWLLSSSKYKEAIEPTFVWVFENCINGEGCDIIDEQHNIHVHLAIHIPEGYEDDIFVKVKSLLEKMAIINERTVHLADTIENLSLSYFLKGCHPDYIDTYGRGREYIYQGIIPGDRRSGTTRNIGPEARKRMDKELGIKRSFPRDY
ncbi:unnamed protein product [Commensalibacter communis]|uniref:Uncharacterized protein n=1 Tax=Commensalibacter communis TaxID=2972786 RepID=A0A9W4XIY1_9PROT|nr:hypothetical protein [Commensalibacter communis]CAI3960002.1 unnamed protein product [Commensalibacter communis]CAI3961037.1 unnamed protein product [Commensalibacter communis]CAI3961160.1 unnamed protein product [Commensalibacter communis]CAI3961649.1 unnamed protein product [Commensalibacter communis]